MLQSVIKETRAEHIQVRNDVHIAAPINTPINMPINMHSAAYFLVFWFFLFSTFSQTVFAESWGEFSSPVKMLDAEYRHDIVDIYSVVDRYALTQRVAILEDPSGELTIEDVSSGEFDTEFSQNPEPIINEGLTNSTFWYRLTLNFRPSAVVLKDSQLWYLEVARSQLDVAELYSPNDSGGFDVSAADIRKSIYERPIVHVNSVFPIVTTLLDERTYYLKIRNKHAFFFQINLWDPIAFVEKVSYEELVFGVFFGGMLIMAFYNIFVFVSVRDPSYLYYFLYVFSITIWQFVELGHGITIVGAEFTVLSKNYLPQLLLFAYFSMLQFTQVFLETERDMPLVDLVFRILKTIFLVNAIAAIFIGSVSAQIWLSYLSFFVMVMLVVVVTFSWLRGNDCARYCFAGMLFTAISGILYILAINGFIPSTSFLLALVPLGTLTGAMFLSFALADRINFLQAAALDASQLSMASLSKYRALFDNAVEGMYRMSLDGNMVSANLSMAKLLGYDSVNLMLSNREQVSDICYADPISQYRQLNDTGMFQAEIAYKKIGGQKAWGRHSARLIKDGEGKPSHIEGTLVDITARREKEKVEIEREKYRVETDVARSSAAAKSEFLANMSHEIRTPLTAIIGYSESLYDDDLAASDEHDSVEIIIRSSYHLLGLIDDILDFSKIEAHELEVESIDVDIAMLMKDVESYFSMKAASQELYFKVNYDFPLPIKLSADPKRLKQILLNLCSNALKFTKSGGVTIDVGWDAERSLMRFSVEDTGIGLTDAQIGKLFQEYSQADESTARDFGGTGLGLLISKTLAELMGGTIEVVSVPGEGSCFSAYIGGELADKKDWVDAWDTSGVKSKKTASGIVIPQLKGRILYAEDNPVNQKLAEMLIVKTGASLMMVDNGKEAVEAVKDNDFDLILMDVQMPVMSGAEAIKIIRDTGYTLPIVALTANVMQEEVKEYESIGCDDCLAKPIVRAVFYQTLEKYLEKIS